MAPSAEHRFAIGKHLYRATRVEPAELRPVAWSFAYFFCLLCGYYILRPVRDEMGIQGGIGNLPWVFTGTFVAMLLTVPVFGAAVARFPRRRLLPGVYLFFIANLGLFFVLLRSGAWPAGVAQAFFIWVSVFNLFAVSVFWSFMTDLYSNDQARRLFPVIAAGGSAGAITGPALTATLSVWFAPANLLPLSMLFLAGALVCILRLGRDAAASAAPTGTGGGMLDGITRVVRSPYLAGICVFILLYSSLSTFLYFEQARIIKLTLSDPAHRTAVFAIMDLLVNVLTLAAQLAVTARLVDRLGLPLTLALVPVLVGAGFACLGVFPTLAVLMAFQVLRRAGNYAVTRPAREMLFTVLPREDKYKSKNFIDTVVYRGGDAASGWLYAGVAALGSELSTLAFAALPLAAVWAIVALVLGRRREARAHTRLGETTP